jgi:hypothetical protein
MKKTNNLTDEEIAEIRIKFKQKHDRSILFQDGSILSQIRDFFRFKGCKSLP